MAPAEQLIIVIVGTLIAGFLGKLIGRVWEIIRCWRNIAKAAELRLVARDCDFTLIKLQRIVKKEVRVDPERSCLSLSYHRKKVMHGEHRIAGLHQYLVENQPDMVGLMDNANAGGIKMPRLVEGDSPVNRGLVTNRYDRDRKYSDINSIMRSCIRHYWNRLHLLLPRFIRRVPCVKSAFDDIKAKHF